MLCGKIEIVAQCLEGIRLKTALGYILIQVNKAPMRDGVHMGIYTRKTF